MIKENDRIAIAGKLVLSKYKDQDEFVIYGDRIAKLDKVKEGLHVQTKEEL